MVLDIKEREIIKKSLIYYFQKLVELSAEKDLVEVSKEDMKNEQAAIIRIQETFENKGNNQEITNQIYRLDDPELNRVVCSALNCYIRGLRKSTEKINVEYGMTTPTISTDEEKKFVEEARKKIPGCLRSE